jgi:hypothetical protein
LDFSDAYLKDVLVGLEIDAEIIKIVFNEKADHDKLIRDGLVIGVLLNEFDSTK